MRNVPDWVLPVGYALFLWALLPMRTALEMGADEGYELMKAYLVAMGYEQYSLIWNDQPPLHTSLLAALFACVRPSVYLARLVTLGFAVLLMSCFFEIVKIKSGRSVAYAASLLLGFSGIMMELSVSVMLELPAFALGLSSVLACCTYVEGRDRRWLLISGALFGLAIQVKLTAIILTPLLLVEFAKLIWHQQATNKMAVMSLLDGTRALFLWGGSAIVTGGIVLLVCVGRDVTTITTMASTFWASHTAPIDPQRSLQAGYEWQASLMWDREWGLIIACVIGMGLAIWEQKAEYMPAIAMLSGAVLIHSLHVPYWAYYDLHFAIPGAWIGGLGVIRWFQVTFRETFPNSGMERVRLTASAFLWAVVLIMVITSAAESLVRTNAELSYAPSVGDSRLVKILKARKNTTRWIFTNQRTIAFWAEIPIPPELAVIPAKRIWSGEITAMEIMNALAKYAPEIIALDEQAIHGYGLSDYLQSKYSLHAHENGVFVFVLKP